MAATRLHWFNASTWNGQPSRYDAMTLCGKVHREVLPDGDEIVRVGACHPYQINCPECKRVMDEKASLAAAPSRPVRCGACDACRHVEATKKIALAEANPPFSHATTSTAVVWNKALRDNPCQAWTPEERAAVAATLRGPGLTKPER